MPKNVSNHFKLVWIISLLLISSNDLFCQFYFERELETTVIQNGQNLKMPWVGGLNGTQYSQMDFNKDGVLDLIAYDRSTELIHCFINNNGNYQYAAEYNHIFPTQIQNLLQLVDFNQDGKLDIFTTGNLGLVAYENVSSGDNFEWKRVSNFLSYESSSGNQVNLQLIVNDYPLISDIDNDGDIDILNFNSNGLNSRIIFYENRSIDLSGKADILQLYEANTSWGDLEECNCNEFVFNGESCNTALYNRKASHAGGKSVFSADLNQDGILELVTSHQECPDLFSFYGANQGQNPIYNTFNASLLNNNETPTNSLYPNTMALKNETGEITSLIVSPNLKAQIGSTVDYKQSNWLYAYTANDQIELMTNRFLQEEMIDWGIQSSPSFWDYDQDGDLDLFVSYTDVDIQSNSYSGIALYKNIGDSNNPSFTLENDNFLDFKNKGISNLLIQLADINNDGHQDLAYQATENGQNNLNILFGNSFDSFDMPITIENVFIGFGYSFHFTPVQGNDNYDLFIGKSSGGLILYENKSTASALNFEKITDSYLSISDDFFRSGIKVSTADLDNNQKMDLIVSDMSGVYKIYSNYKEKSEVYDSLFLPNNQSFLGQSNLLTTATLYDKQLPSIIAGSLSGGLSILRNKIEYDRNHLTTSESLKLYPNPNTGIFNIMLAKDAFLSVISVKGGLIVRDLSLKSGLNQVNLDYLKAGMYIISVRYSDGQLESKKILIQ